MIPVCEPLLAGKEMQYVRDCLKSNWISSQGKYIPLFEEGFAHYCGCTYGISTTSGTTALHLALEVLGIKEGDEVIVPTFTMAASAFAVCYTGATPVFVDCRVDDYNIDPTKIEEAITERTKAIMPVHLYGQPCDMDPIMYLAHKYNLYVIEDAAEAHGATYHGQRMGSIGDIGCFSFYANKIITTGEGGMIICNNPEWAEKARKLKDLAHSPIRFLHETIGYNYRMTNIQAAIGLAQLEKIDQYIAMRRHNAELYHQKLADLPGITFQVENLDTTNVYWMNAVKLLNHNCRDGLAIWLKRNGIQTRNFFIPMHRQPTFQNYQQQFPVADDISGRGLYLPSSSGLTEAQIDTVCTMIRGYLQCE